MVNEISVSELSAALERGNRSWQVASYLARLGIAAVNVDGGLHAWRSSGMPVKQGA